LGASVAQLVEQLTLNQLVSGSSPDRGTIFLFSWPHSGQAGHSRRRCPNLKRPASNAFSKKIENFEAAVSLNFAYYSFCKTHSSLRMTLARAAGIEASAWTVAELVERCGE
jgi:hypothetical protein